ncbi:hypothetical protein [Bradyrhizobium sp. AZCC 2289]|uniref:hypothetical protein n=1 Tax=Bradyrhizobium sp. AZCC 2289 TaxID=3117026 RepID=UPI002FF05037
MLPSSANPALPAALRELGYDLTEIGETERILAGAVVERFKNGELEPLIEGSTKPVAQIVTHAGICKTARYVFIFP